MSTQQAIPTVLALDDPSATLERVGGKGASLARLAAAGLPVPPGFHITTAAYRCFVEENGLQELILDAVVQVVADQPATLVEASERIEKLFAQGRMPDALAEAISRAYAELGADLPVAVRSSATAEDLPQMSFAGQQETYLNMRGEAMVLSAVKRCWASLWTARAIGYRARNHIAPQDVSLAVVVQELVPADAAGILFTANPVTGARGQVMINAAWGLGEAIVGGQVTPDTIVVDRTSGKIIEQQISEKNLMTVRTPEGTREEAVPQERRNRVALSPAQAAELARLGVQIEKLYGLPMDIEWALHEGRVFIVQARPITALPNQSIAAAQQAREDAWELPDPRKKYARSSVFELLPDPLSPLFATLGLPAFSRSSMLLLQKMGIGGGIFSDEMLTTINGYGYYDITFTPAQTVKLVLIIPSLYFGALPGLLRTSRARWQEARTRYAEVVNDWQTRDLTTARARVLLSGARDITAEAARYYLTVQTGILPAAYMSELFFTQVYNRLLKGRNGPTALTFLLGFDSAPIRAEKSLYDLAQWVRTQPELAAELEKMSSEQFAAAYRERTELAEEGAWSEFWQRLTDHLNRFGHAIYDLDFAKALLIDDPVPVLETLKFFLSGNAPDPYKRQATAEAAREEATESTLKNLRGLRLKLFRRLVESAQRYAPLREDALADAGLGWPMLRRMLQEVGRRLVASNALATPDDVFWLTLDELQEATNALDGGRQP